MLFRSWDEAIIYLKKYLEMPEATWVNERCYAMRLLGKAYEHLNNQYEAEKWYRYATAEAPNTIEPWVELAMLSYMRHDWTQCYFCACKALEIKDKALVYTMDPSVWGEKPHDLASISAWHLGLKEKARQHAKDALKLNPTDARLQSNLELMND